MKHLFFLFVVLLLGAETVLAQGTSNDFHIRILAGTDTTPPTTPTLLTVDPAATTQIDITWSASTDNFSVAGYSVLRDGTPIATTSLLGYSDTGLSASTAYSYAVRAFDPTYNYSTTSNSLSTTTLSSPPGPPAPAGGATGPTEATAARVVLTDFFVHTGIATSSLVMETALPARIEVRWGRTASYELGYVVSNIYRRDHVVLLTDLEPGTTYQYEVVGYTQHGFETKLRTGSFTTERDQQIVAPPNVSHFQAIGSGGDVRLLWQLPQSDRLSHVRIVRSHLGFPQHPQDGAIVYQGSGESVTDSGVLAQYSPIYYTAFVYDQSGNISSGAVTIVYASEPALDTPSGSVVPPDEISFPEEIETLPTPSMQEGATSSVAIDRLTADMKMPQPSDITITQGTIHYTLLDTGITLQDSEDFVITIPKEAIAGHLKSIIVSLIDPTSNKQQYSYLLRINHDQTLYSAVVPALGVAGNSRLKLEIYDYEAFVVASYQTPVTFIAAGSDPAAQSAPRSVSSPVLLVVLAIAIPLFLILFLLVFYRRKSRDEDND